MSEPTKAKPVGPVSEELPGRVGKYQILRRLGRGAMGVVYHAHDPLLERDVALKVMLPQIADDPEQKARFEREARAVARMMHPNVVGVFDLGYHADGSPYIAMEFLQGEDLLHAMREGPPMSFEQKLVIVLQVLEGLAHAHRVGIVHRDVKPANIFLNSDGVVKIMDFGVARFTAASVTATGVVLGTANYMSPEQVEGEKVDGRSDLFSVGSLFYELVAGERPFQADSLMTTLYKIAHHEPKFELPPEYETLLPILKKALAKKVEERYQTAAEFAAALRQFLSSFATPGPAAATLPLPVVAAPSPVEALLATPVLEITGAPPADAVRAEDSSGTARPRPDPTGLYRLMIDIYLGVKSGHLHFSHGGERRSLRILRGHIIQGTSDVMGEHLGDVLVRYGQLSQPVLEKAATVVLRERKRLGRVLREMGVMDRDQLEAAVGLHVREILFNVAGRSDGSYFFEELGADLVEEGDLTSKTSLGELILESAKRIQDPDLTRRVMGDTTRILALSSQPLLRSQKITLTPADGFILSRIDGTLSALEVINLVPLASEDTERCLFSLLCTGLVEYLPGAAHLRR